MRIDARAAFAVLPLLFLGSISLTGQNARRSGIHLEDMDTTCKPCADFWRYANGGWLDKNPIPADRPSWGTFDLIREGNRERMKTILDAATADTSAAAGSDRRKLGDFYASCMDTATIDSLGLAPVQNDFDRIAAIQSQHDLNAVLVAFQLSPHVSLSNVNGAVVGPFRLSAAQDRKRPDREIANIGAAATIFSLPDRDYYFRDDEKSRQIRAQFLAHVSRMLQLTGIAPMPADDQAKLVLGFETSLASSVMTVAERRDPEKTYHVMDLNGLRSLAPNFEWALLFHEAGLPEGTAVNVSEPELLKKMNEHLSAGSLDEWKVWLRWRTLAIAAPFLAKPFELESFHFQSGILAGVEQPLPRWETCASLTDQDLSDILGKAYAAKYFPPAAKRRMSVLVENLRAAMRDEIEHSEWMQAVTKKHAILKLNTLQVQIGYPDRWKDYSSVSIDRTAFFANVKSTWAAAQRYELSKIGKPVSRKDWNMTPPTVNAYSSQQEVKVVFPAGILEPPFFDMQADDAANYGAIGAVIGHEMGHQFDDSGSKTDATGTLRNWWTDADRREFDKRTSCVMNQFDTLDVGGGLHHNGKQVLGEALGDLGGLTVSYRAYHKALGGKPAPVLDGYTGDQRFFIAYARVWGRRYRDEAMRLQLNTNNHPVDQFRAIGTLQNMPEFHRAFQCKEGDTMVRPAAQQCFGAHENLPSRAR
jgi:predicted metalloendopeptidase